MKTNEPVIYYYFTSDNGDGARFKIEFTKAVLYTDDNDNMMLDAGEDFGEYPLTELEWSMRLNLLEGYERYDFSVTGTNSGQAGNGGVDLTFVFHYSSAMRSMDQWGKQKFDIDIYIDGQVPAEYRIALYQDITDEVGDCTIGEIEDVNGEGRLYYNKGDEQLGYYSFDKHAVFYKGDIESLSTEDIAVNGYITDTSSKSKRTLVIDYGVNGAGRIHHDPTIGINSALSPIAEAIKDIIVHNPFIFIATAAIASIIVITNIKRRE